ncbi:hypothetical protein CH380_20140 [Leptospira adleri]|uniref:GNAT family N-acetyltransferase n=2 Tax=Leptospira adleri TaxID=2023186 RepID=A0A2M9YIZ1_9LEPT|nr:hypothetical protein [Leptospira adleri]PJZ51466.1 hypothetical protein CH380_20140 [Leptospira adleri]PJZ61707.1 hypothetical protein CH376_12020 [Leptospira adleri]TGM60151.1 hypothetical protein EHQ97_02950 [Leptospira adleri]
MTQTTQDSVLNIHQYSTPPIFWEKDAFICHSFQASDPKHFHTLQMLKDFVYSINMNAGNEYPRKDDGLDPYTTWFYVINENELLSCMRIVLKKPENLIPLESAHLAENPEKQYRVNESNVADWNSVAFVSSLKGAKAAKLNFACVSEFCLNQKFDVVYGMFNDRRKGIGRIYLEAGAQVSKKFPDKISFQDFKTLGEPATFTIIEIEKNSLQKLSEILRS